MLCYKCYIFTNAILLRLILELIGVTLKQQTQLPSYYKNERRKSGQPARQAYNIKKKTLKTFRDHLHMKEWQKMKFIFYHAGVKLL